MAKEVSGPLIQPAAALLGCQPLMMVTNSPISSTTMVMPSWRPQAVERLNHQPSAVNSRITNTAAAMATSFEQIFVYGSLKSGRSAHHLLAGAERQSDGWLDGVRLGRFEGYPMLWSGAQAINGEVYRVDPALMAQLDAYEGVPNDYIRRQRQLRDGRQVWVYMHPSAGL